ncbi:MAG: family 78 glycoside hydrolase catalytic domain [Cytophagales bacterium]|nr:family 78 glycoside hydrolase catalytic domain [Cytophagales bacterium]
MLNNKRIFRNGVVPAALLLSAVLGHIGQIGATEMQVTPDVKGIWMNAEEREDLSFTWRSHWIWMDERMGAGPMLARKDFHLTGMPGEAKIRITASSRYQLYINGNYICHGPARCAPHHQSYDILDISKLLGTGKNLIAVRVHHQEGKYSYHHKGRAGLLVQLDIDTVHGLKSITSDSSWKVMHDRSWESGYHGMNRFQRAVNDRVDMRDYPQGWQDISFNDASWVNASSLMRTVGWPAPPPNAAPQVFTPPWTTLVPRDIPYLRETSVKAIDLMSAADLGQSFVRELNSGQPVEPVKPDGHPDEKIVNGLPDYREKGQPIVIRPSGTSTFCFLLFDFGEVLNGFPQLDIEGQAGMAVDILCAPFLVDGKFTHQVIDSDFRDRIILSGKREKWEATYFKPTRFIGIAIHDIRQAVKLYRAGIRKLEYPFEEIGRMSSEDAPWVKQYMDASVRTIKVCTTDGYTDNYRERRQYAQTGYYASLGNYYTFGDAALQRRYLIQVAREQEANGMMPAYAPAANDDYMIIMDSNCLWIRGLHNYLLYSGDYGTVRELLPSARKLMDLLHTYTNSLGMIDQPPFAYWLDHAVNDRRGANFNLNGHYLGALEDFARVLEWLEEPDHRLYRERGDRLRRSLQKYLWDKEKGLFADALIRGARSDMFSEHANAMALALNVATDDQAESIVKQLIHGGEHNYIKRESGITMVTPAMSYFLHKGLCEYGYIAESFDLFRSRFDKMLASGTNGTLWEEWWLDATGRSGKLQKGRTRSDAQTESAFPPALFAEYLLGVAPETPGMEEMVISYRDSGLNHIEGVVPTPEGKLRVKWNTKHGGMALEVDVPGNMKVKVDLKTLGLKPGDKIQINGKPRWIDPERFPFLILSKGRQSINL